MISTFLAMLVVLQQSNEAVLAVHPEKPKT